MLAWEASLGATLDRPLSRTRRPFDDDSFDDDDENDFDHDDDDENDDDEVDEISFGI